MLCENLDLMKQLLGCSTFWNIPLILRAYGPHTTAPPYRAVGVWKDNAREIYTVECPSSCNNQQADYVPDRLWAPRNGHLQYRQRPECRGTPVDSCVFLRFHGDR